MRIFMSFVFGVVLANGVLAGHAPQTKPSRPTQAPPKSRLNLQSEAPQVTLTERPMATESTQTARNHVRAEHHQPTGLKRKLGDRMRRLFHQPRAMKRNKRRSNVLAGVIGFLGLCAGLISNWWGVLLLVAPANYSTLLVSGFVLGLMLLAGYLGFQSLNKETGNPWGIAAVVSALVSLALLVVFLVLLV